MRNVLRSTMGLLRLRRIRVGGRRELSFRMAVVGRVARLVDHRMRHDNESKKAQLLIEHGHRSLFPRARARGE